MASKKHSIKIKGRLKNQGKLLKMLMILFVTSCATAIKFDPNLYIGNPTARAIVPERGDVIDTDSPAFSFYGCMHVDKWKELKEILIRNGSTSPSILGLGFGGK